MSVVAVLQRHLKGKCLAQNVVDATATTLLLHSRSIISTASSFRSYASKTAHDRRGIPASTHSIPASSSRDVQANESTSPSSVPPPDQPFPAPYHHRRPTSPRRSPITNWVLATPGRTAFFLRLGDLLGYGSPKQLAAARSKVLYEICSEVADGAERPFWYDTLSLPPSFQSWFLITNLHIWLLTVRLRALPRPHGRSFIQALIDHFFFDVEDRVRAVLGKKAPERLVTRHMKILREQWGGLGLAFDYALITGDKDMASAVWRNLLGARGAQGIAFPESIGSPASAPTFHSKNVDSSVSGSRKVEDPSSGGVADFEGSDIDKYIMYPQLMLTLVGYFRRELVRLEEVSDRDILGGVGRGLRGSLLVTEAGAEAPKDLRGVIKFGKVRDAARKIGSDAGKI